MAFNTSRQSIDRIRQRYAASGDVKDLPRSGRPRATNRAEDRLITTTTLRNRFTNAPTTTRRIRQQRGAGGIPVSVQTIRNRLHAAGLKSRVPAKKPCLSQRHRAARLQFARNHVRWNRQQWRTVTFSDESRFCLRHIDGRLRVWRRNGERHGETYWVQRQSGWLYSLLSQGADQRWNKVWQVKINSQCQNDEIKLLIFLFCLSVVSLLSIAVQ